MKSWATLILPLALCACATGPTANPQDPLEPMNRGVAKFNDKVDEAVLKPVATAYQKAVPALVRTGVSNVYNNLADVGSLTNNLLQGKLQNSVDMMARIQLNTMFGLGGIFNVADQLNVERHSQDFGQTLGHWGVPSGPYVVLPVLGPSSVRDATGVVVDFQADPVSRVKKVAARNSLTGVRIVNTRANLLSASNLLDEAALDKYSFTRDAYLQRRQSLISDGQDSGEQAEDPSKPAAVAPSPPASQASQPN